MIATRLRGLLAKLIGQQEPPVKELCKEMINRIRKLRAQRLGFDVYEDADGEWQWMDNIDTEQPLSLPRKAIGHLEIAKPIMAVPEDNETVH